MRINAGENHPELACKYEKKSLLDTMQRLEKKRIDSENKLIARRISTQ